MTEEEVKGQYWKFFEEEPLYEIYKYDIILTHINILLHYLLLLIIS